MPELMSGPMYRVYLFPSSRRIDVLCPLPTVVAKAGNNRIREELLTSQPRPAKLSRNYMKQLPMLWISHVRRIIPFFFPDHLDVKTLKQLQHLFSGVVRPIRDRRPGITFPKKLPSEPAAWTNRRDDLVPEPRKMPRLAKRQRKARVHQIAGGNSHLRKVHLDSCQPRLPCF